ncbi:hypothetical protein BLAHAN_05927 [Blautia hansenii DSM 20583]|uniref:Uncharacterized protein n=1 Tax=Blautia hansenii DSM 20583 TaxID=537007 RepID=C9L945_BLAHA|nr:hypothetical protein BLAHAN_05927 [Blautia hansenii DSM 20583]
MYLQDLVDGSSFLLIEKAIIKHIEQPANAVKSKMPLYMQRKAKDNPIQVVMRIPFLLCLLYFFIKLEIIAFS